MEGTLVFLILRQQMQHIGNVKQDKIRHSESSICLTSGGGLIYIYISMDVSIISYTSCV